MSEWMAGTFGFCVLPYYTQCIFILKTTFTSEPITIEGALSRFEEMYFNIYHVHVHTQTMLSYTQFPNGVRFACGEYAVAVEFLPAPKSEWSCALQLSAIKQKTIIFILWFEIHTTPLKIFSGLCHLLCTHKHKHSRTQFSVGPGKLCAYCWCTGKHTQKTTHFRMENGYACLPVGKHQHPATPVGWASEYMYTRRRIRKRINAFWQLLWYLRLYVRACVCVWYEVCASHVRPIFECTIQLEAY